MRMCKKERVSGLAGSMGRIASCCAAYLGRKSVRKSVPIILTFGYSLKNIPVQRGTEEKNTCVGVEGCCVMNYLINSSLKCRMHDFKNVILLVNGIIDSMFKHFYPLQFFYFNTIFAILLDKVRRIMKTGRSVASRG